MQEETYLLPRKRDPRSGDYIESNDKAEENDQEGEETEQEEQQEKGQDGNQNDVLNSSDSSDPEGSDFDERKFIDYGSSEEEFEKKSEEQSDQKFDGWVMNRKYRYELTHWCYHFREAQNLWSVKEQQESTDWRYVWDKLLKFMRDDRSAFHVWLQLHCRHESSISYKQISKGGPLHMAAFLGLSSFARVLIDKGYRINQRCQDASRIAERYAYPLDFSVCSAKLDVATVKVFVDHGANLNYPDSPLLNVSNYSITAFHRAVSAEPSKDFIRYLLGHGGDPSFKDRLGEAAIHWFSKTGTDPNALRLLLEARSDVNLINIISSHRRQTPLHILVERKNDFSHDLLKAYLEAGANVNRDDGYSMSMSAAISCYNLH